MKFGEKHAAEAAASKLREKFPSLHSVGVGTDGSGPALYAYGRQKKDGKGLPEEFGGFKVTFRPIGFVRPAFAGQDVSRLNDRCSRCGQLFGVHGAAAPHAIGEPGPGDIVKRSCVGFKGSRER